MDKLGRRLQELRVKENPTRGSLRNWIFCGPLRSTLLTHSRILPNAQPSELGNSLRAEPHAAALPTSGLRLLVLLVFRSCSPSDRVGSCRGLVHRRVQRTKLRSLPVLRPRRNAEVPIPPGQLDRFSKIELRILGEPGEQERLRVKIPSDGKFSGEQLIDSLRGSVDHTHIDAVRSSLDADHQSRPRLRPRLKIWKFRETAPDDIANRRRRPGAAHPKRDCLDRTSPLARRSLASRRKAISCSCVKGPSSGS